MRTLLALAVALLVSGCGGADRGSASRSEPTPAPPSSSPSTSASPFTPAPGAPGVATGRACTEVRAGVRAFNLSRYDETVRHFVAAVPLAEREADGSRGSAELLEAVKYYADLAAEDYLAAARSSSAFARYKAITLGQCFPPASPASPEPRGFDT